MLRRRLVLLGHTRSSSSCLFLRRRGEEGAGTPSRGLIAFVGQCHGIAVPPHQQQQVRCASSSAAASAASKKKTKKVSASLPLKKSSTNKAASTPSSSSLNASSSPTMSRAKGKQQQQQEEERNSTAIPSSAAVAEVEATEEAEVVGVRITEGVAVAAGGEAVVAGEGDRRDTEARGHITNLRSVAAVTSGGAGGNSSGVIGKKSRDVGDDVVAEGLNATPQPSRAKAEEKDGETNEGSHCSSVPPPSPSAPPPPTVSASSSSSSPSVLPTALPSLPSASTSKVKTIWYNTHLTFPASDALYHLQQGAEMGILMGRVGGDAGADGRGAHNNSKKNEKAAAAAVSVASEPPNAFAPFADGHFKALMRNTFKGGEGGEESSGGTAAVAGNGNGNGNSRATLAEGNDTTSSSHCGDGHDGTSTGDWDALFESRAVSSHFKRRRRQDEHDDADGGGAAQQQQQRTAVSALDALCPPLTVVTDTGRSTVTVVPSSSSTSSPSTSAENGKEEENKEVWSVFDCDLTPTSVLANEMFAHHHIMLNANIKVNTKKKVAEEGSHSARNNGGSGEEKERTSNGNSNGRGGREAHPHSSSSPSPSSSSSSSAAAAADQLFDVMGATGGYFTSRFANTHYHDAAWHSLLPSLTSSTSSSTTPSSSLDPSARQIFGLHRKRPLALTVKDYSLWGRFVAPHSDQQKQKTSIHHHDDDAPQQQRGTATNLSHSPPLHSLPHRLLLKHLAAFSGGAPSNTYKLGLRLPLAEGSALLAHGPMASYITSIAGSNDAKVRALPVHQRLRLDYVANNGGSNSGNGGRATSNGGSGGGTSSSSSSMAVPSSSSSSSTIAAALLLALPKAFIVDDRPRYDPFSPFADPNALSTPIAMARTGGSLGFTHSSSSSSSSSSLSPNNNASAAALSGDSINKSNGDGDAAAADNRLVTVDDGPLGMWLTGPRASGWALYTSRLLDPSTTNSTSSIGSGSIAGSGGSASGSTNTTKAMRDAMRDVMAYEHYEAWQRERERKDGKGRDAGDGVRSSSGSSRDAAAEDSGWRAGVYVGTSSSSSSSPPLSKTSAAALAKQERYRLASERYFFNKASFGVLAEAEAEEGTMTAAPSSSSLSSGGTHRHRVASAKDGCPTAPSSPSFSPSALLPPAAAVDVAIHQQPMASIISAASLRYKWHLLHGDAYYSWQRWAAEREREGREGRGAADAGGEGEEGCVNRASDQKKKRLCSSEGTPLPLPLPLPTYGQCYMHLYSLCQLCANDWSGASYTYERDLTIESSFGTVPSPSPRGSGGGGGGNANSSGNSTTTVVNADAVLAAMRAVSPLEAIVAVNDCNPALATAPSHVVTPFSSSSAASAAAGGGDGGRGARSRATSSSSSYPYPFSLSTVSLTPMLSPTVVYGAFLDGVANGPSLGSLSGHSAVGSGGAHHGRGFGIVPDLTVVRFGGSGGSGGCNGDERGNGDTDNMIAMRSPSPSSPSSPPPAPPVPGSEFPPFRDFVWETNNQQQQNQQQQRRDLATTATTAVGSAGSPQSQQEGKHDDDDEGLLFPGHGIAYAFRMMTVVPSFTPNTRHTTHDPFHQHYAHQSVWFPLFHAFTAVPSSLGFLLSSVLMVPNGAGGGTEGNPMLLPVKKDKAPPSLSSSSASHSGADDANTAATKSAIRRVPIDFSSMFGSSSSSSPALMMPTAAFSYVSSAAGTTTGSSAVSTSVGGFAAATAAAHSHAWLLEMLRSYCDARQISGLQRRFGVEPSTSIKRRAAKRMGVNGAAAEEEMEVEQPLLQVSPLTRVLLVTDLLPPAEYGFGGDGGGAVCSAASASATIGFTASEGRFIGTSNIGWLSDELLSLDCTGAGSSSAASSLIASNVWAFGLHPLTFTRRVWPFMVSLAVASARGGSGSDAVANSYSYTISLRSLADVLLFVHEHGAERGVALLALYLRAMGASLMAPSAAADGPSLHPVESIVSVDVASDAVIFTTHQKISTPTY